jgi:hypothetical protein
MIAVPEDSYLQIQAGLVHAGLYSPEENGVDSTWRIAPDPYLLTPKEHAFFLGLGEHLLKFYSVLNEFYHESAKGRLPEWVAEYLDAGKPRELVDYGRMNRFRRLLPGIIRPDVMVTEKGFTVTELDSVPGGFGRLAGLMELYAGAGREMVGASGGGIPGLFYRMAESVAGLKASVVIVVSDEAQDYRAEMNYLGALLRQRGLPVFVRHPKEIIFKEEGLFVEDAGNEIRIDLVYRFFELFDLKNVAKSELLLYCNKKERVCTTPPYKAYLEEKSAFALFHHPVLKASWEKALGPETFATLSHLIPNTWVLDNREAPPHTVIPGLYIKGRNVQRWSELFTLSQKERELVVKPSGFSPEAWGSRGVVIGHDVSQEEWKKNLERRLREFPQPVSVLQEFHKGRRVKFSYFHPQTHATTEMDTRVRLTPYYFVVEGRAELGGILATLCPHDKKKIHGMVDAVMAPCAVEHFPD